MILPERDRYRRRRRRRVRRLVTTITMIVVTGLAGAGLVTWGRMIQVGIEWIEPYGPPGAPRMLQLHEVTNEELEYCRREGRCQGRPALAESQPLVCVERIEYGQRRLVLGEAAGEETLACMPWRDATYLARHATRVRTGSEPCYDQMGAWQESECEEGYFSPRAGQMLPASKRGFALTMDGRPVRSLQDAAMNGVRAAMTPDCWVHVTVARVEEDAVNLRSEGFREPTQGVRGVAWKEGNRAATCVTAREAMRYADWINRREGFPTCYEEAGPGERCRGYRLPTFEEWANAAYAYAWPNANEVEKEGAGMQDKAPSGTAVKSRLETKRSVEALVQGTAKDVGTGGGETRSTPGGMDDVPLWRSDVPTHTAACGTEPRVPICDGTRTGREAPGEDRMPSGHTALVLGVRELVHATDSVGNKGFVAIGWSNADAAESVSIDTTRSALTRVRLTNVSHEWSARSDTGLRLLRPAPPIGIGEWVRTRVKEAMR